MADRYGSRTVFAAAIGVFMGGSLLCAASDSLHAFVIARFLQGIGGAMMVPVGRLVLMRAVEKRDYVAALNYLTIPALLGPVIGPALGGAITLYFHWRWIFLINIPIGILGIFLVLRHIPNVREADIPQFDLRGFALSGIGLSLSMLGFSALGGDLLPLPVTAACIVAGAAALFKVRAPCATDRASGHRPAAVSRADVLARRPSRGACSASASARRRSCCRCCSRSASA